MGMIKITRLGEGDRKKSKLYIDANFVEVIRNGQPQYFAVPEGFHRIFIEDFTQSNVLEIEIKKNDTVSLVF